MRRTGSKPVCIPFCFYISACRRLCINFLLIHTYIKKHSRVLLRLSLTLLKMRPCLSLYKNSFLKFKTARRYTNSAVYLDA